jgi:hypothetical protein
MKKEKSQDQLPQHDNPFSRNTKRLPPNTTMDQLTGTDNLTPQNEDQSFLPQVN